MKFLLVITCIISTWCFAQTTKNISGNHQQLHWKGKAAVGSYAPQGTLNILSGSITYTRDEIISLTLVVDMSSLYQENQQLQNHLKDKDFFYVKKFPTATFTLNNNAAFTGGKTTLNGTMTIRGNNKIENILASVKISEETITISINQTMDRTKYGINHNSPSLFKKLKENAIDDNFIIRACLTFQ